MQKKILLAMLAGFLIGMIWLMAIRFLTYQNADTHYHANFALYVNGERDMFDNFTFYEEVQSCGSDEVNNPRTRVHLHDRIATVAHVHDTAATWGHLFANWGYTLGDDVLKTDDGVFANGAEAKLRFWLNGKEVDGAANRTIRSEDALLISYGTEDETTLQQRYETIVKDAADYNKRNDPSACKGTKPATLRQRLQAAFDVL